MDAAEYNSAGEGKLPGHLGLVITDIGPGFARGQMTIGEQHFATNGFLHAATVVALADTLCGDGCMESLPEGASGFTTIELKSNFLGAAREGVITAEARLIHGGRTTQVWDAEVKAEATGRAIAAFRCTQMVLYPRP